MIVRALRTPAPPPALCKGVDVGLTDDVVAAAFARTLERGGSVRRRDAYVYRVAFRLAQKLRRPPTVEAVPERAEWDDPGVVELFDALAHLSPGQRAAVFLRHQEDLPVAQVARMMGTSSGTVRIHLLRARGRLAALLGDEDHD